MLEPNLQVKCKDNEIGLIDDTDYMDTNRDDYTITYSLKKCEKDSEKEVVLDYPENSSIAAVIVEDGYYVGTLTIEGEDGTVTTSESILKINSLEVCLAEKADEFKKSNCGCEDEFDFEEFTKIRLGIIAVKDAFELDCKEDVICLIDGVSSMCQTDQNCAC